MLAAGIDEAGNRVGRTDRIVLAVSGGPDSLALLLVAAELHRSADSGGPEFIVVTVDHGLRPEAAAEARFVADVADGLGLPHRTMRLTGGLASGNVPAAARRGRYALLLQAAREADATVIVTAHHEGDLFETHLHARARRAGPVGLAAMRHVRDLAPDVALLRPFLDVPGADLKALVAGRGIAAVDDPTNHDTRYERVRLRHELAEADHPRLRRDIARHRGDRDALEGALAAFVYLAEAAGEFRASDDGVLRIGRQAWRQHAADTAFALLARALAAVSGGDYPPGADSVLRLQAALAGPERVAATLGGVVVAADTDTITFLREYGRDGIAATQPGDGEAVFDGRFLVRLPPQADLRNARLMAFGAWQRGNGVERTLPVLAGEGGLLAVPAALVHKAPDDCLRLELSALLRWRLLRDLPRPDRPLADKGESVAAGFAANAPGRVGKAGDTPYL